MTRYLRKFSLPYIENRQGYPYYVLAPKKLRRLDFESITIFYGSNGCGKSTLLNIIARKLELKMSDRGNDAQFLQPVIDKSFFELDPMICMDYMIPVASRFIRSEEVMHAIVKIRQKNEMLKQHLQTNRPDLYEKFFKSKGWTGGVSDYDNWVYDMLSKFDNAKSNGELAFDYFESMMSLETLILLDEPENSMAPKFQKKLAGMILDYARFFHCQFIIATHSPFLLAIPDAKIYNLDETPAKVSKVSELESIRLYKELMSKI